MTDHDKRYFSELLKAVLKRKGLSQHQLAHHAEVSQAAISLIGSEQRSLSDELAVAFARILGGAAEDWKDAYEEYKSGSPRTLNMYLERFVGGLEKGQDYGVGVRRLLNSDMLELFWKGERRKDCSILGFDPRRVGTSFYYTRIGYVDGLGADPTRPITEKFEIPRGALFRVRTLESFFFPLWLEGEIHPASGLGKLGLSVENGPTIDPGFDKGSLIVTIKNLGNAAVTLDPKDPFLKIRFWVFDRMARSQSEYLDMFGSRTVSDEIIIRNATQTL